MRDKHSLPITTRSVPSAACHRLIDTPPPADDGRHRRHGPWPHPSPLDDHRNDIHGATGDPFADDDRHVRDVLGALGLPAAPGGRRHAIASNHGRGAPITRRQRA